MSVMANCSIRIDFLLEQIIKQSRWGEIIVHDKFVAQSLNSSNNLQHCSVHCCYLSCGMLPLLAQIHAHIISVAQSHKVCRFWFQIFYVSLEYVAKDYSSFVEHDHFVHSKMFCQIVQFTKFVVQCTKNLSYFPKSVIVWVVMVQRVVIVFKMRVSKNVEEVITSHYIWIKWNAVLLLSGLIIFEAVTLAMPHLNHKSKKYVHFFDGNIRWLRWSASCSSRWHVLMEVAVCFG